MVSPAGNKPNENPINKPNEKDIIGPYPHQKINGWDYWGAVPGVGSLTSLARIAKDFHKYVKCKKDKDYAKKNIKATINSLEKGAIEVIPGVGTGFVVYALYKDKHLKPIKDLDSDTLKPQEGQDHKKTHLSSEELELLNLLYDPSPQFKPSVEASSQTQPGTYTIEGFDQTFDNLLDDSPPIIQPFKPPEKFEFDINDYLEDDYSQRTLYEEASDLSDMIFEFESTSDDNQMPILAEVKEVLNLYTSQVESSSFVSEKLLKVLNKLNSLNESNTNLINDIEAKSDINPLLKKSIVVLEQIKGKF